MGLMEEAIADIRVFQIGASIETSNLNLTLILTDEIPNTIIPDRVREYLQISDILDDWGETSKVYKAAVPHFQQEPHSASIKIGRAIQKGAVIDVGGSTFGTVAGQGYAIVLNVCTITSVDHGFKAGQEVVIINDSYTPGVGAVLDGTYVITDAPSDDTFTFATAEADRSGETLDYSAKSSYSVVSGVAVVTSEDHGLSVNEEITTANSSGSPLLNGVKTVFSVLSGNAFTFIAAGVTDETGTLSYHTGDASLTVALNNIYEFDASWGHLVSIFKEKADILEIAAWNEGKTSIYGFTVEDADTYDPNETNSLYLSLAALDYDNTYMIWYHQSGVDVSDVEITVGDETARVRSVGHGLRIDDPLTVSGTGGQGGLKGNKTVLNIESLDIFDYDAEGLTAGIDVLTLSFAIAAGVVTVDSALHGLVAGQIIFVKNSTIANLDGFQIITAAPTAGTFTFSTSEGDDTGTLDYSEPEAVLVDYFARYSFFESAISGFQLSKQIGTTSWGHKPVGGFAATPNDILTPPQALNMGDKAGAKNVNFYKEAFGSAEFIWGRVISGRTIKTQFVKIWLQVRCQEAAGRLFKTVEQILYTNADLAEIANTFQSPLGTMLSRRGITPYDTSNNWLIEYERAENVPQADKDENIMRFNITVRRGNEILNIAVNLGITD